MTLKGFLAFLALSIAIAAYGQVKVAASTGNTETMNRIKPGMGVSSQDRRYFAEARVATVFNMRLMEVATQHATSDWAKAFAEMRLKDYAQNYAELKVIGSKLSIKVDKALPGAWERKHSQVANSNGGAFDAAFRRSFISVNEQFADQSEREVKHGNNSLIRNFAVTQGPVIRLNIKMAERRTVKI